ncbi:MAG TPA: hypothetical protein VK957_11115 [Lunatimonas sp.]|nr:hypothetical protein [Lunatimonas sp.]
MYLDTLIASALQILALRNAGSAVAKAEACLTRDLVEIRSFFEIILNPEEFAYVRVVRGF